MHSNLDIFSTICDVIGWWNEGIYEKEITLLDTLNEPFTLTTYFCEKSMEMVSTSPRG
jgi:hypothetical protein